MGFGRELVRRKSEPRCRHVKRRKVGAAERASSWSADRQLHRAANPPVRRIAHHAAAVEYRVPDKAFGIDRRAIGHTGSIVHGREYAARTDRSRSKIEIIDEDGLHMTVGEIHPPIIRTSAHTVRDPYAIIDGIKMSTLKSIETAARALHRLSHRANPKSPVPVTAAVIEYVDRATVLRIDDPIERSARGIVVSEFAAPGDQQSATRARRERAELFRWRPALKLAAHRIQTMNGGLERIDPIKRSLDRMPARNLAENVHSVRDACNFDHDDLSSPSISGATCKELR